MKSPAPWGEASPPGPRELAVGADLAGARLDRALGLLMPEGLRGRRRRIAGGGVLINGRPCTDAGRRMKDGEVLGLAPAPSAPAPAPEARLLGRQGDYCFLYKGAGLHSAALAGKEGCSLEALLPALCAPVLEAGEKPKLLQRLDHGTSGIVCAALTPEAVGAFRAAEGAGECEKRYLALLTGCLEAPVTARHPLDTKNRRTTRLRPGEAEALRQTEFLPLHIWEAEAPAPLRVLRGRDGAGPPGLTLAGCRIRLGARHQIRAHAAALGLPLLGDTRYADRREEAPEAPSFFLHHGFLAWPVGRCSVAPPWAWLQSLPPEARHRVSAWLGTAD